MAMNIANAIFVFVLFILAYFLTTRLQFYELLEGNFDNFGAEQLDSKSDALDSSNNRNVELLETGRSNNWSSLFYFYTQQIFSYHFVS